MAGQLNSWRTPQGWICSRQVLLPTWRGWLLLVLLGAAGILGAAHFIHPLFAVTDRVEARVLVVEGWVPDYVFEAAVTEYHEGGYRHIYTTGGPVDHILFSETSQNYAELGAGALQRLGIPENEVTAVPSSERYRNRTFLAAAALAKYWRAQQLPVEPLNVVTYSAHARRSWLCFRRAFGPKVPIGIISIPSKEYDAERWWRFSAGVKSLVNESLALFYASLTIDYGD